MKSKEPLMLYIHIPFCERKCDYCDFVSFACNEESKAGYFKALFRQIELKAELAGDRTVSSVFIGGGTPSCVNEKYIYELMENLRRRFRIEDTAEITMEANPNSLRDEALKVYREGGVNRLSMGLQSANDEELKRLSRLHSYEDFLRAYGAVREAGFDNVNVDLMSALPGQTIKSFEATLNKVIALKPEHISAYSLIIEEGTKFGDLYGDGNGLPGEDEDRRMYHMTQSMLEAGGYHRYEISNYAKPGRECRHNTGYWTRRPYLGLGLAAASLFEEKRYSMHTNLEDYIKGDFTESLEELSVKDQMEEFMFLGLRLIEGISKEDFRKSFKVTYDSVYKEVDDKLLKDGLILSDDRVRLTEKGLDLANYAMARFLLD